MPIQDGINNPDIRIEIIIVMRNLVILWLFLLAVSSPINQSKLMFEKKKVQHSYLNRTSILNKSMNIVNKMGINKMSSHFQQRELIPNRNLSKYDKVSNDSDSGPAYLDQAVGEVLSGSGMESRTSLISMLSFDQVLIDFIQEKYQDQYQNITGFLRNQQIQLKSMLSNGWSHGDDFINSSDVDGYSNIQVDQPFKYPLITKISDGAALSQKQQVQIKDGIIAAGWRNGTKEDTKGDIKGDIKGNTKGDIKGNTKGDIKGNTEWMIQIYHEKDGQLEQLYDKDIVIQCVQKVEMMVLVQKLFVLCGDQAIWIDFESDLEYVSKNSQRLLNIMSDSHELVLQKIKQGRITHDPNTRQLELDELECRCGKRIVKMNDSLLIVECMDKKENKVMFQEVELKVEKQMMRGMKIWVFLKTSLVFGILNILMMLVWVFGVFYRDYLRYRKVVRINDESQLYLALDGSQ